MQESTSEVSILIPTYNRAHLIRNAIESSLIQTYKCQIIVCDHGSNDETQKICESYGKSIKYLRREEDYGIHFCELESILASNGKFIHFCFDDDWMHPEFISKCMTLMDDSTGAVFTGFKNIQLKKSNQEYLKWDQIDSLQFNILPSWKVIPKVMARVISPSRALVRKKDALRCMYISTNLMSDSYYNGVGPDWLITAYPLFHYRKCAYIQNELVNFGVHESSITCDVVNKNEAKKTNSFKAAYRGAKLYLVISFLIKKIKLEKFIVFLELFFKIIKKILTKLNFKFL